MRSLPILLLACWSLPVPAQSGAQEGGRSETAPAVWTAPDAPRPLPTDVLEDLRSDPDYRYEVDEAEAAVSWIDRFRQWVLNRLRALFEGGDAEGAGRVVTYILYGLAAVLLGWALLKLARMNGTSPLSRGGGRGEAAGDDFADASRTVTDLSTLLDEAARAGRYVEAVRWHYLRLLGTLGRTGLLDLQPSKTNRRYRADLAGHAFGPEFARVSRLFDRVVYGGVDLDAERYAAVRDRLSAAEALVANGAARPAEPVRA